MENAFKIETSDAMLNTFSKEVALNELRETEENKENGLKELKTLLLLELEKSNIFLPLHNELWLMNFLRVCKFYPDSAKERILSYLKIKKEKCEYAVKRLSVNDVIDLLQSNAFNVFKCRDQLGRRIIVQRIGNWPRHLSAYDMLNVSATVLDALRLETLTQIHGYIFILDLTNLALWQLAQITPKYVQFFTKMVMVQPARLKGFHVVNSSFIFKPIFNLAIKFLPDKYRSRVYLHDRNLKSLYRFISNDYLPDFLGGHCTSQMYDNTEFCNFIQQSIKYLDDFQNCGYKN